MAAWERAGSAGTTGASPKSRTRSSANASTPVSRFRPGGQLAARIARREAGARPVGDKLINRGAQDHDVRAPEFGWVLRVRHAAVRKWTRVVGLLADPGPAAERV